MAVADHPATGRPFLNFRPKELSTEEEIPNHIAFALRHNGCNRLLDPAETMTGIVGERCVFTDLATIYAEGLRGSVWLGSP